MMGEFMPRWIATPLFGVSIAAYVSLVLIQRGRWTSNINHLLHLAMSATMIAMAWGVAKRLRETETVIFFALAGFWFAAAACRPTSPASDRLTNGYSAVMMAAMAWMFVAMNSGPSSPFSHSPEHAQPVAGAIEMSAMEMPSHTMPQPGSAIEWFAAANTVVAIGFGAAALYWACRFFAKRQLNTAPQTGKLANLEPLHQACSAAGTALMFATLS